VPADRIFYLFSAARETLFKRYLELQLLNMFVVLECPSVTTSYKVGFPVKSHLISNTM